jgi:spore maturation protein CgeB
MYLRHFGLFDAVYLFDKDSVAKLKARGIRHVHYLPCACDPTTFHPQKLNPLDYPDLNCTIGFVATYYPGRAELLSQMKGLDIGLWGGSWWEAAHELRDLPDGYWRGHRITPADAARVYNLARICPNVHHPQTHFGGLNTRTFEIPAAGGFELVDNVPGLAEHFMIGREMVAYSSPVHFRELAEYYLSHPFERTEILESGHARVMRDHTYKQRLEVILKALSSTGEAASVERSIPIS